MGRIRKSQVWLALAVLALMTAGSAVSQEKDPADEKKTNIWDRRKPLEAKPKDDELRKLQIARYNQSLLELATLVEVVMRGAKMPDVLFDAQKRLVQSGLEVFDKPEDRISLLTDYVAMAKDAENVFQAQLQAGRVTLADAHLATYWRIDAEIQLLKAKRAAEKPKDK